MTQTAGMCKGTPDWQLEGMIGSETAREWEEQTAEQIQPIELISKERRIEAWAAIEVVITSDFDNALTYIEDAIREVRNTPEEDKLASLHDRLNDLSTELLELQKRIWR